MAVIKHISSKNANYAAAPLYLCFQHNEQTQRPLLDEEGHYIPREAYQISGIRCTPDSFPLDCLKADLHYNQNRKKGDIKTHHYILSFDPRDRTDHGLTLEDVQQMGEQFCKAHFPGHIALVCSHADGHQYAGNLHCHMVIHSLRVEDVERKSYMDRPCDSRAGAKHRCTGKLMRYLREQVMKLCQGRGLHQIDLLSGAQKKVTDREYHAQRSGQAALERKNTLLTEQGKTPKETIFDTQKEELRQAIDATWPKCRTLEEFVERLFQDYGIEVTESRGRFSYLHPNAKKKIADRRLGEGYRKGAIEHGIDEQNHRREQPGRSSEDADFVLTEAGLTAVRRAAGLELADVEPSEQAGAGKQPLEAVSHGAARADGPAHPGAEPGAGADGAGHDRPASIRQRLRRAGQQSQQQQPPAPKRHRRSHEESR